ncbi:MAG TPA: hypothetical protein PK990_03310 [Salinivirgaceae bacterium]|nr:hypothetical protein [Salinivirgaceae bacterium]
MINLSNSFLNNILKNLDCSTGKFFRHTLFYVLKAAAVGMAIFGAYLIISGIFGKTGYFSTLKGSFTGFELTRSIICFAITLVINILFFLTISGILWSRAEGFKDSDTTGVLFIFPKLLKIAGEVLCLIPAFISVISFFAILLAAIPYAPIEGVMQLSGGIGSSMINDVVGNTFSAIFIQNFSDYINLLFNGGLLGLFRGFAIGFVILLGAYLVAEFFEILLYFLLRQQKK